MSIFTIMLLSKGKILLKVNYVGSEVHITPIVGEFDNGELLSAYARNEELITQAFLTTNLIGEPKIHLVDYFRQRGWHVEH